MEAFRELVNRYGLRWSHNVPRWAYNRLAEINKVLNEADRREALQETTVNTFTGK